ncbi:unnamed protein product [Arctia plantaginis]|uniref:Uncharacterized protein n=1 Tax=Arctia plantaginis TaxID=874455 RepID=A0A8S1BF79_ARCPL|nr:unnamed protein product [Arctia plantaginis]
MRRALPNECAFCKNNEKNEECFSSHAMKDARVVPGVACVSLPALRCDRRPGAHHQVGARKPGVSQTRAPVHNFAIRRERRRSTSVYSNCTGRFTCHLS